MTGWQARQLAEQTGRTFVVTGATSGVGLATARDLVGRGAHVVLAVRDPERGVRVAAELGGSTSVLGLDLADLDSVAAGAARLLDELGAAGRPLSALVCNAGVMGGPRLSTAQGFERQMGTNHLGHAALVTAVWPALAAAGGRVVALSSIAARRGRLHAGTTRADLVDPTPYSAQQVYSNTKQANLLFAQELHRRASAAGSPVSAVAAHPGVAWTNLFPRQLAEQGRGWLVPAARLVGPRVLMSAEDGALPVLRALDRSTPPGSFVGPAGLGQTRGAPELLEVYRTGRDPAAAARLWELTAEILGTPLPA